jgi:hypothetical protein
MKQTVVRKMLKLSNMAYSYRKIPIIVQFIYTCMQKRVMIVCELILVHVQDVTDRYREELHQMSVQLEKLKVSIYI